MRYRPLRPSSITPFMREHREWKKLISELETRPLWVILRSVGASEEKSIMRAIDGRKAQNMTVYDTIDYCLNSEDLSTDERIMARSLKTILQGNDFSIRINKNPSNVPLDKPILNFAYRSREYLDEKSWEYWYADIEISGRGTGGFKQQLFEIVGEEDATYTPS